MVPIKVEVERVELIYARLPKRKPFRTSFGVQHDRHVILCAAHAGGLVGWGECVPDDDPSYSYETVETVWHVLTQFLVPDLLNQPLTSPDEAAALWIRRRGHPIAKAGLEAALWDLCAQAEGLSLADYLWKRGDYQGQRPDRVRVGVSIGIQETIEETLDEVAGYLEQGYGRIKLKIEPGRDVEVVRRVRERFGRIPLWLDANGAYTLDDAEVLRELGRLEPVMIEQPLYHDDIYLHSLLQPQLETDICLDESIRHARDAHAALELGACRVINIKPGRVGGLGEARRIHDLCRGRGVPVWCGGMLESGIGRAANVALASLPGFALPGDLSASERYFWRDIIDPPFTLNTEDSTLSVPDGPGLGITLDGDFLQTLIERRADLYHG
jgi:O-succinylbenzoate synthase